MSPSDSILTAMTIPYFPLGICFRKVGLPIRVILVLIFFFQCYLVVFLLFWTVKIFLFDILMLFMLFAWLISCLLCNWHLVLNASKIRSLLQESLDHLAAETSKRLTRKIWIASIFVVLCYIVSFAEILLRHIFQLPPTSFSRILLNPFYENNVMSGAFIYLSAFEVVNADIRYRLENLVKQKSFHLIHLEITNIRSQLENFEHLFNFLPFMWLTSFFFTISFYVIKMDVSGQDVILIIDKIQDLQEPFVTIIVIIWLEKRLNQLWRLCDELEQFIIKHIISSTWEDVTLKVAIVRQLEELHDFKPTGFSFVNLDRRLILSFMGSAVYFTILFINMSQ